MNGVLVSMWKEAVIACRSVRTYGIRLKRLRETTPAGQPVILPRLELDTFNTTLTCSVEQAEG
jgi:hypothetical protein